MKVTLTETKAKTVPNQIRYIVIGKEDISDRDWISICERIYNPIWNKVDRIWTEIWDQVDDELKEEY